MAMDRARLEKDEIVALCGLLGNNDGYAKILSLGYSGTFTIEDVQTHEVRRVHRGDLRKMTRMSKERKLALAALCLK